MSSVVVFMVHSHRVVRVLCAVLALAAVVWTGQGAWAQETLHLDQVTQDVRLRPGWNAVYIHVDAPIQQRIEMLTESRAAAIGAHAPTSEFGQYSNAIDLLETSNWTSDPAWAIREIDQTDSGDVETAAEALMPGRCNLIRVEADRVDPIRLRGVPSGRRQHWRGMAGALFSPRVMAEETPSLSSSFESSAVLDGGTVYELTAGEGWRVIHDTDARQVAPGECFFFKTPRYSDFQGAAEAQVSASDTVGFRPESIQRRLRLRNRTDRRLGFALSTPGFPAVGELARPAIFVWSPEKGAEEVVEADPMDAADVGWEPLPPDGAPLTIDVPARGTLDLRVGGNMAAAALWARSQRTEDEVEIKSVLRVQAGGSVIMLPVRFDVSAVQPLLTGLWVGDAAVTHVGRIGPGADGLDPVTRPFLFRLIVLKKPDGSCSLLSDAIELEDGTDGTRVLLTDEAGAKDLVTLGAVPVQRFRSVAYVTRGPLPEDTSAASLPGRPKCLEPGSEVSFALVLAHDDVLNPDLHVGHPDHDGLDERYENYLDANKESRHFERHLRLIVGAPDDARRFRSAWSDREVVGTLRETITGMIDQSVETSGVFVLRRLSEATLAETQTEE